jgi:hypothetical protein
VRSHVSVSAVTARSGVRLISCSLVRCLLRVCGISIFCFDFLFDVGFSFASYSLQWEDRFCDSPRCSFLVLMDFPVPLCSRYGPTLFDLFFMNLLLENSQDLKGSFLVSALATSFESSQVMCSGHHVFTRDDCSLPHHGSLFSFDRAVQCLG